MHPKTLWQYRGIVLRLTKFSNRFNIEQQEAAYRQYISPKLCVK